MRAKILDKMYHFEFLILRKRRFVSASIPTEFTEKFEKYIAGKSLIAVAPPFPTENYKDAFIEIKGKWRKLLGISLYPSMIHYR